MNRKRIKMDYGHLPVGQLPEKVKAFVAKDPELQAWFEQKDWLQSLLALKRAEAPDPSAVDRIQYRVETRLANASPDDLAAAASSGEARGLRGFFFGYDSETGSRNPFSVIATPLTIAAGMAIGLTAVHYMTSPAVPGESLFLPNAEPTTGLPTVKAQGSSTNMPAVNTEVFHSGVK